MKRIALFFCLTINLLSMPAQTNITGIVTDSLNNPVPFASVYLNNSTIGDNTDSRGIYTLKVNQEGVYELIATCIGFKSSSRIIRINKNPLVVNIKIYPDPNELKEVIVEAMSKNRIKDYSRFREAFLGETVNSKNCKIRNLKDVYLNQVFIKDMQRFSGNLIWFPVMMVKLFCDFLCLKDYQA